MKILVVSDTHGNEDNLSRVLEEVGMPDHLIHLGDAESGEGRIRDMVQCPVHIVAGNCDFFSDLPTTEIVEIGDQRILITHGHYYYVSVGIRDLVEDARANDCNVAMFGHTHRPFLDQSDGDVTVLNPGSLSYPRQDGRRPSYALMTLDGHGGADFELCYL